MKHIKMSELVVLLLVLALVSCTAVVPPITDAVGHRVSVERVVDGYYDIYRVVDEAENVVCYVIQESISCVRRGGR